MMSGIFGMPPAAVALLRDWEWEWKCGLGMGMGI